jgi:DNA-binding NarL/FixJ family response regulator
MYILYLEDNPIDANLTQISLNRAFANLQMDVCHRLSDALGKLDQSPPPAYELVITDLNLPDGSGLDLLSHIRSQGLPYAVIVVTGQMDEGIILSALKAGATITSSNAKIISNACQPPSRIPYSAMLQKRKSKNAPSKCFTQTITPGMWN